VEDLLTAKDVAQMLKLKPKTVLRFDFPWVKLSERCVRARQADVERYVADHVK